MKRFAFPLDTVLRVRRIEAGIARAELLAAQRDLADARDRCATRAADYAALPRPAGRQPAAEFGRARDRLEASAVAVLAARAAVAATAELCDARRAAWRAADTRVETLERLEARSRDAHAAEVRRFEDRLVDDLVTARHARPAQEGPR